MYIALITSSLSMISSISLKKSTFFNCSTVMLELSFNTFKLVIFFLFENYFFTVCTQLKKYYYIYPLLNDDFGLYLHWILTYSFISPFIFYLIDKSKFYNIVSIVNFSDALNEFCEKIALAFLWILAVWGLLYSFT